jgi:uncharacterized delta-60 repeat protein
MKWWDRGSGRRARPGLEALEGREVPAIIGGLDPAFDGDGKLTANPGLVPAAAVAVDTHGRVVVVGPAEGGLDILVTRLNPDGSPDLAFGPGGRRTLNYAGGSAGAAAVVVDGADNVIVAGQSVVGTARQAAVARLTAAGALDPTFAGDGTTTFDFAPGVESAVSGVALDPTTGAIVVGGSAVAPGAGAFAAARLTPAGVLDTGFAGDGTATFPIGTGTRDVAHAVAVDRTGRVVLTGFSDSGTRTDMAVARLTAAGLPDAAFAGDGTTLVDLGPGRDLSAGNAVAAGPDGSVYIAGSTTTTAASRTELAVAKLTAAGVLDSGWAFSGFPGRYVIDLGRQGFTEGRGLALRPDGKVVVGGTTRLDPVHPVDPLLTDHDFFVLQLTRDGWEDFTFNARGVWTGVNLIDFGAEAFDDLRGMAVGADGRIVAAGGPRAGFGTELARLVGTVGLPADLAVTGPADGTVSVFTPDPATRQYDPSPARVAPFGAAGSVRAAAGDVNGDGFEDTVVVTGPGGPVRFAVVSGRDRTTLLVPSTDPFGDPGFTGGAFVATGDVNADGRSEWVISPDQGGGPRAVVYSFADGTATVRANFFGIDDPAFRGGARVALGDLDGDTRADLAVAAGFLGGPRVAVYRGATLLAGGVPPKLVANDFFAFDGPDAVTLRNGVFVAAGDADADGFADLIAGGGPGGGPRVLILSGALVSDGHVEAAQAAPVGNFFAGDPTGRGGVRVAARDADGDDRADVVAASGEGEPSQVRVYPYLGYTPSDFDFDPYSATLPGGVFVG